MEEKYREFRAMGYDHIEAREMASKHFELMERKRSMKLLEKAYKTNYEIVP